jgi:2-polyprenyl-6-methoxyphenol hydroxylase-like FAD-dependent oxidoreductase
MKDNAPKNRKVLISGASVAGPALAYWLSRYGFRPTVVEQAPRLREGGYKIDIRGTAVEVAERMGIMADIREASTNMRGSTFVNSTNKPIATLPADFLAGRTERDDEIMRGDLACILYERTRHDAEYLFGDSITSIMQDDAGVRVTFEKSESRSFDLVVGADGLHSNVRALTFGEEEQFIHHLGAYISIFSIPNYLNLDHWELYYGSVGCAACIYSARENSEARGLLMFTAPALHYDWRDSAQQQKILTGRFAKIGWQVPRLLEFARNASDFYFDSVSLVQMDHWSSGRVVLLGDAAYCASPASGQGTSLALVGAYVLAGELASAAGDYRSAFANYENAMRGFVEANQKFALNSLSNMVPRTQAQLWLQSMAMRVLPHIPWKKSIVEKIVADIQRAANAITLKDYDC